MTSAVCPKCTAQLPPLAHACQYCGLETHHGAMERQRGMAASAAHANVQRDTATRAVASRAGLAMMLGLGSLITCCFPVGIAAIVVGVGANKSAASSNVPKDVKAMLGIVLGAISLVAFTGVAIGVGVQHANQAKRGSELASKTDEKRKATEIDLATACALAEARLIADGYAGKTLLDTFTCRGPFDSKSAHPTLGGIDAKMGDASFKLRACFLRNDKRWFVVNISASQTPCESITLTGATGPSPVEWEVAETEARKLYFTEASRVRSQRLLAALTDVPRILKLPVSPAQTTCSPTRLRELQTRRSATPLTPVTIDAETLRTEGAGKAAWPFLTSSEVTPLFDPGSSVYAKGSAADAIARNGESLVVVYSSDARAWPEGKVQGGKVGYSGGTFKGRVVVVDTDTRTALCSLPISVETDAVVKYYAAKAATPAQNAVALQTAAIAQLKERMKTKTNEVLTTASAGELKLGFKALE